MGAVESMVIYGLYKVTMDLAVCYELKSEFGDEVGYKQSPLILLWPNGS